MKNFIFHVIFILSIFLSGCKIADISIETNSKLTDQESELKATKLLQKVIRLQNFNKLDSSITYSFTANDHWPGLLGKMTKLWPDQSTNFQFNYNFNTFDGQAHFLDGEKEGDLIGLQSWNFYERKRDEPSITKKPNDNHQSHVFGLAVFHYFVELPYRLSNAPYKRYYGEAAIRDQKYDLVFVSWIDENPHPEYDQYIVYINRKTGLLDYCIYTLRDNKNPLTRNKYGSIAYVNYQDFDGFRVATDMPIMIDDGVLHTPLENYFHKISIKDFSLGSFEESILYPIPGIEKQIDSK